MTRFNRKSAARKKIAQTVDELMNLDEMIWSQLGLSSRPYGDKYIDMMKETVERLSAYGTIPQNVIDGLVQENFHSMATACEIHNGTYSMDELIETEREFCQKYCPGDLVRYSRRNRKATRCKVAEEKVRRVQDQLNGSWKDLYIYERGGLYGWTLKDYDTAIIGTDAIFNSKEEAIADFEETQPTYKLSRRARRNKRAQQRGVWYQGKDGITGIELDDDYFIDDSNGNHGVVTYMEDTDTWTASIVAGSSPYPYSRQDGFSTLEEAQAWCEDILFGGRTSRRNKRAATIEDMRSDIERTKEKLRESPMRENFGDDEVRRIRDEYSELQIENYGEFSSLISNFADWCATYSPYTARRAMRKVSRKRTAHTKIASMFDFIGTDEHGNEIELEAEFTFTQGDYEPWMCEITGFDEYGVGYAEDSYNAFLEACYDLDIEPSAWAEDEAGRITAKRAGRKFAEKYYINGWQEGESYFMELGRFTEDELMRLRDGEEITKGDNVFRIEAKVKKADAAIHERLTELLGEYMLELSSYEIDQYGWILQDFVDWLGDKNATDIMYRSSKMARRVKKADGNWRGNPDIQMKYNGDWADPDLIYNGYVFNYWDIENALWEMFIEDGGSESDEAGFDRYVQENAVGYLEDVIAGGYFSNGSKSWHNAKRTRKARRVKKADIWEDDGDYLLGHDFIGHTFQAWKPNTVNNSQWELDVAWGNEDLSDWGVGGEPHNVGRFNTFEELDDYVTREWYNQDKWAKKAGRTRKARKIKMSSTYELWWHDNVDGDYLVSSYDNEVDAYANLDWYNKNSDLSMGSYEVVKVGKRTKSAMNTDGWGVDARDVEQFLDDEGPWADEDEVREAIYAYIDDHMIYYNDQWGLLEEYVSLDDIFSALSAKGIDPWLEYQDDIINDLSYELDHWTEENFEKEARKKISKTALRRKVAAYGEEVAWEIEDLLDFDGPFEDEDEVQEYIDSCIDNKLIYYADMWKAIEDYGDPQEIWEQNEEIFLNFYDAVMGELGDLSRWVKEEGEE